MMTKHAVKAICISTIVAFGVADISFAGNGNGNGKGKGSAAKSENAKKDKAGSQGAAKPAKGSGEHPSELKKLNGVLNANPNAIENASVNSPLGMARTYRDATVAARELQNELDGLNEELTSLTSERTQEQVDAEIAELDPAVDADRIAELESEKSGLRTQEEVDGAIAATQTRIAEVGTELAENEAIAGQALSNLGGGAPLTPEAQALIDQKLGLTS